MTLTMMSGLYDIHFEMAPAPPRPTATSLAITWMQSIVIASVWVGLTLPGMIEEPGSFSGSPVRPGPRAGRRRASRMSLAIFVSDTASVRNAPDR